jgi:hypothetical protein
VSYFGDQGERVEMIDGEIVPLGIALSLSLRPIEFSGGYRLPAYRFGRRGQVTLVPFVGAGAGVVRYHEETDDANPDENVSERVASYHVLLGLDVPLGRRVAIGAEFRRRWVPDGAGNGRHLAGPRRNGSRRLRCVDASPHHFLNRRQSSHAPRKNWTGSMV